MLLPVLGRFNKSIAKFHQGRKNLFSSLKENTKNLERPIWIHAASLGEYEQAVPLIKVFKEKGYAVVVSFFSPSGYDVKYNDQLIDAATYLPLDTKQDMQKFVDMIEPQMALFIKYDIWPNLMKILSEKKIPSYLISANFRENQIYFKWYGSFFLKALKRFKKVYVQNGHSYKLAENLKLQSIAISGDTRYDRVMEQLDYDNEVEGITSFINNQFCMVCGSTWPEDEKILAELINQSSDQEKFIIAPHKVDPEHINAIENLLKTKTLRWSEAKANTDLKAYQVLIIDCIGLLTKLYSYADISYVGGAMGQTGLHNILEPACFGKPVIFGNQHQKFLEAKQLIIAKAGFDIKDAKQLQKRYQTLISSEEKRLEIGQNAKKFVYQNAGATSLIMKEILN